MGAPTAGATPPMRYMASGTGATSASAGPSQAAPRTVLNIVSGKPTLPTQPQNVATSSVGPARGYAKAASPMLTGDAPKVGPPAVAVGRAMAEGRGSVTRDANGKLRAPIGKKYQIVFVTGEVAPFSKTGGLGEAMDGLPIALAALGHRCMVVSPRYDQYKEAWDTGYWSSVPMGGKQESVHFFHTFKQKVDYVFVDHPTFLERVDGLTGSKLYGPEWGKDFADNQARFAYFGKAALKAIQELPLGGGVYGGDVMVVCNDWHSALVPMFIHAEKSANPGKWYNTKTAFLCHNAVFQGRFPCEEGLAQIFGVPQRYIDGITFKQPLRIGKYNEKVSCINTMAAGLRYSDRALTVSPTYAQEVTTDPEKGVELEQLFKMAKCTGILNGVKEGVSPSEMNFVTKTMMSCGPFTAATADAAKTELKNLYRQQNNLVASKGPLMCFIGRLDAQKGYDLLLESLMEVLEDTELQIVIVGAGRADLVAQTKALEKQFPDKLFYAGWMGPERYALLAGCDFTLLPSRWEPCGLVQMEAMRLGTLPIVAPTGGLKDTVEDGLNGLWTDSEMTVEAVVDEESVASIGKALRRAAKLFQSEPSKVVEMKKAAMAAAAEFTWSNAALQYEAIFQELNVKDVLPQCGGQTTVTLETDKQVC
ncbi:WAXY [Symbiodinium pilosum]|uniref:Granule-bound starch synthase 1, chloroplastic/amyloplastic n=1 Tax=Symbiodinium pilosum TaxID=2952 RepID=A0A812Q5B9_SYMPI|nr:WAXY [Symbiodinium pilosum]